MEPIYREYGFELRSNVGDGLTLEGYAAVFDSPTEIHERGRTFTEVVARGAFKKTLSERTPVLMFNHGKHPLIGDMPIGAITSTREDVHGVFVRARLADNWLVQPVRDAIANQSIHGMSFRMNPINDKWNAARTHRTLLELAVPEFGPVVFPAYTGTEVSVRAQEAVDAITDPEVRTDLAYWLMRDATDLSALAEGAVREDTPEHEPPVATEQEPVNGEVTPEPTNTRRERLDALARLKGIIE